MKPLISLIHASYGRPEKAFEARRMWQDHAASPERVEYVFALNLDDPAYEAYTAKLRPLPPMMKIAHGCFDGSAPAWDAGADLATGSVFVQVSDDLEPPVGWDYEITKRMDWAGCPGWTEKPIYVAVSDGYRKDDLCTCAIMTAAYARQKGSFIPPCYRSVFSDDEVTYRALVDARDKRVTFINARDLVFTHRHHYHDKAVAWDATYARGNQPKLYDEGAFIFHNRNPEAARDGLRTWA